MLGSNLTFARLSSSCFFFFKNSSSDSGCKQTAQY